MRRYAAVGAASGRWSGATLYAEAGGTLTPIGAGAGRRAVGGVLAAPLGSSRGLRFEAAATLMLALEDEEAALEPARVEAIALGANRLLVGGELLQFAAAEPLGYGLWSLKGLLRGRGGTEAEAMKGHRAGTPATLLDDRLLELPESLSLPEDGKIVAIGPGDETPVAAAVEQVGLSRRPWFPVHAVVRREPDGALALGWTRRARGGWAWLEEVEQPLVEQAERYEVGLGDPAAPSALWSTTAPALALDAVELGALAAAHAGEALWVRQRGSFALSHALFLTTL